MAFPAFFRSLSWDFLWSRSTSSLMTPSLSRKAAHITCLAVPLCMAPAWSATSAYLSGVPASLTNSFVTYPQTFFPLEMRSGRISLSRSDFPGGKSSRIRCSHAYTDVFERAVGYASNLPSLPCILTTRFWLSISTKSLSQGWSVRWRTIETAAFSLLWNSKNFSMSMSIYRSPYSTTKSSLMRCAA